MLDFATGDWFGYSAYALIIHLLSRSQIPSTTSAPRRATTSYRLLMIVYSYQNVARDLRTDKRIGLGSRKWRNVLPIREVDIATR